MVRQGYTLRLGLALKHLLTPVPHPEAGTTNNPSAHRKKPWLIQGGTAQGHPSQDSVQTWLAAKPAFSGSV